MRYMLSTACGLFLACSFAGLAFADETAAGPGAGISDAPGSSSSASAPDSPAGNGSGSAPGRGIGFGAHGSEPEGADADAPGPGSENVYGAPEAASGFAAPRKSATEGAGTPAAPSGSASARPAAQGAVVMELYTSQGCISCPPADAFFADLTDVPGLIALSLHVDYWDYIGWEDSFGQPEFTERQKNYARAIGLRTIYTPQFVINGRDRIEGFDPAGITAALSRAAAEPRPVRLVAERSGDSLSILADIAQAPPRPVLVELVRYLPEATVLIERGENAGKKVTYQNIVSSWQTLGEWSGVEHLEVSVPMEGEAPGIVIVQEPGPGAILAATIVE